MLIISPKLQKRKKEKNTKNIFLESNSKLSKSSLIEPPCPICYADLIDPKARIPGCDHEFCLNCIMDWLAVQTHCPLCKKNVKKIEKIIKGKTVETIKI